LSKENYLVPTMEIEPTFFYHPTNSLVTVPTADSWPQSLRHEPVNFFSEFEDVTLQANHHMVADVLAVP
jgi:hypothetical protein